MRKKSLIRRLIPWIIAAVAIAALVIFVGIPLYSQTEVTNENPPVVSYFEGKEKELVMENDDLLFTMDTATTQFTVTEKESGRVWRSNPEDAAQDSIALSLNKDTLFSTLILTYTTSGGEVSMNNYTYSIKNQSYDLAQQEDGSVRVDYSVGQIERTYIIPTAITKERYTAFTDQMSKSTKKKVSSNYSLVEPDKLDKRDNKEQLLTNYPSVAEQALYILQETPTPTIRKSWKAISPKSDTTKRNMPLTRNWWQTLPRIRVRSST
jgi:hypothetical protein